MDPLLQPFTLKNLTLRNRVVSTSHEPAFGHDGMPQERYRAYHVEKARGGVGLTMIGGSAVIAPDSPPAFGNLLLYRDEIVPHLRRLADEVHAEGAAVMSQITHLGRRSSNFTADWLPLVAPSPLREKSHRAFPKQAESWDLDRIVDDFVSGAQRLQAGGMDGLELEAYGHILDGFLSPHTNQRTDEYGGSPEARLAFPRRVVQAVREAVGPDFIIGIRMTVEEDLATGLHRDEAIAALRTLVDDGIDFLSVIRGQIESDPGLLKVIPGMGMTSAPHLDFAGEIRRELNIPVMHAARIADVATARHAISAGLLDLVGMTRAQMADPYLVAKLSEGDEDRIRPCVGASYCLDAIYVSGDAKCIHNPATGRELVLPQRISPAAQKKRAVVVGAGPAGLEAARVLAERGHQVSLHEAADKPGGQVRLAATLQRRRDLLGIIDWRVSECHTLGVDLKLNSYLEPDEILAENADIVVLATGGVPNTEFLDSGTKFVHDAWDILSRSVTGKANVLIYDDNGSHPALDAAEFLAETGCHVEYVTPERTVGVDIGGMNITAYLAAFGRHDVTVTLAQQLKRVEKRGDKLAATFYSEYTGGETERLVDQVVVEHGTLPDTELYEKLLPHSSNLGAVDHGQLLALAPQTSARNPDGSFVLYRVGDAVSSRNIHAAILDSLRLCAPM